MLKKLVEFIDREVEIWTTENTEPWMGVLKAADADSVTIMIDERWRSRFTRNRPTPGIPHEQS